LPSGRKTAAALRSRICLPCLKGGGPPQAVEEFARYFGRREVSKDAAHACPRGYVRALNELKVVGFRALTVEDYSCRKHQPPARVVRGLGRIETPQRFWYFLAPKSTYQSRSDWYNSPSGRKTADAQGIWYLLCSNVYDKHYCVSWYKLKKLPGK